MSEPWYPFESTVNVLQNAQWQILLWAIITSVQIQQIICETECDDWQ
jgi:hypothetical protein